MTDETVDLSGTEIGRLAARIGGGKEKPTHVKGARLFDREAGMLSAMASWPRDWVKAGVAERRKRYKCRRCMLKIQCRQDAWMIWPSTIG